MLRIIVFGTFSETFLKQNKILQKKKKSKEKIRKIVGGARAGEPSFIGDGACRGDARAGGAVGDSAGNDTVRRLHGALRHGENEAAAQGWRRRRLQHTGQLVQKRRKDQDLA